LTATADFDLSSLSISSPYLKVLPEQGEKTIRLKLSKKENILEIAPLHVGLPKSNIELQGKILDPFGPAKSFEAHAGGILSLPEMVDTFPWLEQEEFSLKEKTPLSLTLTGSLNQQGTLQIDKGTLKAFGSQIAIDGAIDRALSQKPSLSLNARYSFDQEEILKYFPLITISDWQINCLAPLSLHIAGPYDAIKIEGTSKLEGLDIKSPYVWIRTPEHGGQIQLKALLEGMEKLSIQNFTLKLGDTSLTLQGDVQASNMDIKAQGRAATEELMSFLSPALLKEFRIQGPLSFNANLKGDLNTFALKADMDLTRTFWEEPSFITKPEGLDSAATITLLKNKHETETWWDGRWLIESLTLNLGDSYLNVHGAVVNSLSQNMDIDIQGQGTWNTGDIMTLFGQSLPDGFSMQGLMPLSAAFKGSPTSFSLKADVDLTEAYWEDPYIIAKAAGLTNHATVTIYKDNEIPIPWGEAEWSLESANGRLSLSHLQENERPWYLELTTSPIELSGIQSLKWHQKNELDTGTININLRAFISPIDFRKSSFDGFIELQDVFFPLNNKGGSINAQLMAKGDHLDIPLLTVNYGNSDLSLKGNLSWAEAFMFKGSLISNVFDLTDFIPIPDQEIPSEQTTTPDDQNAWPVLLRKTLESYPLVKLDATVNSLYLGEQHIRNVTAALHSQEGYYDVEIGFITPEDESSIQATIAPLAQQSYKGEYLFNIHGLNLTELAKQLRWQDIPITGTLDARGKVENISSFENGWLTPDSLNGNLNLTLAKGEFKKFPLIRNVLLLMKLPLGIAFVPVLREVFLFDQAIQLAKTKGRIINLKTFPYDRIGGTFLIEQGVGTTNDLLLTSDVLTMAASASIDLTNQTLKGKIAARPFGSMSSLIGKVPIIGKAVQGLQDKLVVTNFTVQGPLKKPEVKAVALESLIGETKETYGRLNDLIKPKKQSQ
jgi:hypothetical protein